MYYLLTSNKNCHLSSFPTNSTASSFVQTTIYSLKPCKLLIGASQWQTSDFSTTCTLANHGAAVFTVWQQVSGMLVASQAM